VFWRKPWGRFLLPAALCALVGLVVLRRGSRGPAEAVHGPDDVVKARTTIDAEPNATSSSVAATRTALDPPSKLDAGQTAVSRAVHGANYRASLMVETCAPDAVDRAIAILVAAGAARAESAQWAARYFGAKCRGAGGGNR
jgi:hypothetical protein